MQEVITLFKRDYEGNRLVYDEVVEGAEWVIAGEGRATEKIDGTVYAYYLSETETVSGFWTVEVEEEI